MIAMLMTIFRMFFWEVWSKRKSLSIERNRSIRNPEGIDKFDVRVGNMEIRYKVSAFLSFITVVDFENRLSNSDNKYHRN